MKRDPIDQVEEALDRIDRAEAAKQKESGNA